MRAGLLRKLLAPSNEAPAASTATTTLTARMTTPEVLPWDLLWVWVFCMMISNVMDASPCLAPSNLLCAVTQPATVHTPHQALISFAPRNNPIAVALRGTLLIVFSRPLANVSPPSMAREQVRRWAMEHPTAPRTGHFFEVPLSHTMPRVGAVMALAGALWYTNYLVFWNKKPATFSPEFIAEHNAKGAVAVSCLSRHAKLRNTIAGLIPRLL